jgi:hypothetical protein
VSISISELIFNFNFFYDFIAKLNSYYNFKFFYFKYIKISRSACDSPDKDFLSKEEFFSFCLDNKDILIILLADRKMNLAKK